jgi:hypothetical protein
MERMFNEPDFTYGQAAQEIDQQTIRAIDQIFKFWVKEGYSPREIGYVMRNSIRDVELGNFLDRRQHER